ncbi:uncharacterized protein LOC134841658 [Symsagittifera roscoffensis]|uniref:uncharacterized protein LOC134841658 n=1 Tax=Symsagittifera roscoffensis TaxID=84072 RepID=UPI00307BEF27
MKHAGLKCEPSKCEILRDSIKYLVRLVDKHGLRPDPEAVEAVLTRKAPKTDTQLMSFLGFANYYREFVKRYTDKIHPMQQLMRNKGKSSLGPMRHKFHLKTLNKNFARQQSSAWQQRWGCLC